MHAQRTVIALVSASLTLAALPAQEAQAIPPSTTIQVNDAASDAPLSSAGEAGRTCESTDATGDCTLRAAVDLANLLSIESGQRVTVELPAGTYTNTLAGGGALTIATDANVAIAGAGARQTAIDGGKVESVIYVEASAAFALQGATVRDGAEFFGGGILAELGTSVRIVDSTITENQAAIGGGVFVAEPEAIPVAPARKPAKQGIVRGSPPVPPTEGLWIVGSTIAHNEAEDVGGGIYLENDRLENQIVNSTIADNQAGGAGGGIATSFAGVLLSMDTLADNLAAGATASGNIAESEPAVVFLHQTLIAEPAPAGGPGCESFSEDQPAFTPVTFGYNLDYPSTPPGAGEVDACGLTEEAHDLVGVDPRLEPSGLTDNGGPTDTIAPMGGYSATPSPAVDVVPLAECGTPVQDGIEPVGEDQRGSPRPDPNGSNPEPDCDIGAYEFAATILTPACSTPAPVNLGERVTVLCTIEKSEGLFATGVSASFSLPAGATLDSATPSQGSCSGMTCQLGTVDPASVSIVLTPSASGALAFSATDNERPGAKSTSVPVSVTTKALPLPAAPKPHQCKSRRDFKIHIQNVKRLNIVSAVIYVNKRREQAVKGKALHAAIDLRGLPKGKFTVRIVARTASGKRLVGVRIYHTCVGRRPSHKHLFL